MGEKESIITSAGIIASPEPGGYWLSGTGRTSSTSCTSCTGSTSSTSSTSRTSR